LGGTGPDQERFAYLPSALEEGPVQLTAFTALQLQVGVQGLALR